MQSAHRPTAVAPISAGSKSAPGKNVPGAPPALSVVLVAGTRVRLARLETLLATSGVEVRGTARNAVEACQLVTEHRPDTVLLDLALPAGGLDTVENLMSRCPLPIVLTGAAAEQPAPALAAGAVDVVAPSTEALGPAQYAGALARHLQVASRVRVITHPRARLRDRGYLPRESPLPEASRVTLAPVDPTPGAVPMTRRLESVPPLSSAVVGAGRVGIRPPVVAIGASTGGPPALAALLSCLPADLPAAVIVIQHMADGFVESLASWLDGLVAMPVSVAQEGERLRAGTVVLAPSQGNVELDSNLRIRITPARADQFHIPEVDTTFRSVAEVCRGNSIGVLLTGMGRDGAIGLRLLREGGAFTIGQDEPTSAVWGMPGAAQALDAVTLELPLPQIAGAVIDAVQRLTPAQDAS